MNGSGLQEGWHGTLVLAHFCEVHGPSIVYCTQMFAVTSPLYSLSKESEEKSEDDYPKTRPTEETTVKTTSQKAKSGSCCDVNESQGYLSFESVLNCYLISHRNPQPLFYSKIRTACIRSLSCEVTPNREGPLLFCEEADCLCALSYVFRISDSQARGFTRSYSLILLTPDKMRLVSSVRYIIAALKEFSDQLKAKANIAFELERVNNDGAFVSKTRQLGFPGGRYIRSDAKKLRSLTELLSMPDLFLRLHSRNSFLLRGWYSKYVEITLGISTSKPTNGVSLENLVDQALQSWSESESDGVPKSDRNFFEVTQKTEFQDLKRMIQDFSQGEKLTETYSNLLSWLGPTNMRNLIYNILTGNQIIVQAVNILPIIPIMRLFQELLPLACCSLVPFSQTYKERWECNLLGISSASHIPSILGEGTYTLILISESEITYHDLSTGPKTLTENASSATLGRDIEQLLTRDINSSTKLRLLSLKKQEWLNMAKTFYWMARSVDKVTDLRLKQYLKAMNLVEADVPILRFWVSGVRTSDFICKRIYQEQSDIPLSDNFPNSR